MEICQSTNGDCKAKTGVYLEHQVSSGKEYQAPPPPISELPLSTLPARTGLKKWNSTPVIHKDFSTRTFPSARKAPNSEEHREAFLRSTEHILATFYGLVFIIEGTEWHILKSEYLPIYFVRVSVKDVKYPFRILVIDNESENHVRVVDFIVNCRTKTSIKEVAVCWQDKETFGAKFSSKSHAFQFYDTISRMASTLRKGEELEFKNSDQMVVLEICLPNSETRSYRFYKTDTLKGALKMVCTREKLRISDHYFHHMQRTDDSLDMALRVGDLRTDKIRIVSRKERQASSSDTIDKITDEFQGSDCNDSAVADRQSSHTLARATKSDTSVVKTASNTLPQRNVKRKAPQPPKLVIPKYGQTTPVVNGYPTIGGKKMTKKRRAPSPPNAAIPEIPTNDGMSPSQNDLKETTPPSPRSINTEVSVSLSETEHEVNQISQASEHKPLFPVFIAPPPPESTPPPIDECETPVGPIDSEQDDGSVEIPVEINGIIEDTMSLDSKSSEKIENEAIKDVEVKVEVELNDTDSGTTESSKTENKTVSQIDNQNGLPEVGTTEFNAMVAEGKDTVDGDLPLKKNELNISNSIEVNKPEDINDNKIPQNQEIRDMTPEQLQALLLKTQNPQEPLNLQNQQLFAMQQNQQMLSNILLQQMLQQQMAQQRQPNILPMMGGVMPNISPLHPMQPGGMIPPVATIPAAQAQMNGHNYQAPMWPQPQPPLQHPQSPVQPLPAQAIPPNEPKPTDEVESTINSTDGSTKEPGSESGTQTEPKTPPPVKEEELVNRPLFKKMLAQVSQGKIQGVPPKLAKQTSYESETTPKSPVSPTGKITKVPTSYVSSAEKNIPQSKPEEEKRTPIIIGEIGRKSSYVDSAIGKKNVDSLIQNDVKVASTVPESSPVTVSKPLTMVVNEDSAKNQPDGLSKPNFPIEKASQHLVIETDSPKISPSTPIESVTKPRSPNDKSNAISSPNGPVENILMDNKTVVNVSIKADEKPEQAPPIQMSSMTGGVSLPSRDYERKFVPINNNLNFSAKPEISKPEAIVVSHNPRPAKPPVVSPKPRNLSSSTSNPLSPTNPPVNTHKEYNREVSAKSHDPSNQEHTVSKPQNVTSVAEQAARLAAEKRNSLNTARKSSFEEPLLGGLRYQKTIVPPLSTSNTTSTQLSRNGVQYKDSTAGNKNEGVKPIVAKKPRHLSEPRPAVANKPTYDIRQTKTLPKTRKAQHLQISLSLTPEERMQIHNHSSGK
ncbi:uncharacterized protein LOC114521567 isoform X2 [Dendronephthya gigantea]|uniref:uncharacterized protein LOC114521567 isoform X2 n=1 Tax=Dendronephthya gigantea TaxID=151771 RepID=UPI00106D0A35|nr:uncharacterized protein LOC114521567 isoform X2 [Dendronephthya gigantea]